MSSATQSRVGNRGVPAAFFHQFLNHVYSRASLAVCVQQGGVGVQKHRAPLYCVTQKKVEREEAGCVVRA